MSWREQIGGKSADDTSFAVPSSQQDSADAEAAEMFGVGEGAVHPCWQPVTLPSGLHIYENRYTGGARTLVAVAPMLLLAQKHAAAAWLTYLQVIAAVSTSWLSATGLKSVQSRLNIHKSASM